MRKRGTICRSFITHFVFFFQFSLGVGWWRISLASRRWTGGLQKGLGIPLEMPRAPRKWVQPSPTVLQWVSRLYFPFWNSQPRQADYRRGEGWAELLLLNYSCIFSIKRSFCLYACRRRMGVKVSWRPCCLLRFSLLDSTVDFFFHLG